MPLTKKKREQIKEMVQKPRRQLTAKERADLGRKLLGPKTTIRRALFTLEAQDLEWLDKMVAQINPSTRRKTNKSELVRLGLSLMKKKGAKEIKELLRELT
jgi:hypothetical protein